MKKWIAVIVTLMLLANAFAMTAYADGDFAARFQNPGAETSIKVRTWWPNANASEEEIRREVNDIAGAGFGCIELICIPQSWEIRGTGGVSQDSNAAAYGWGTEAWNEAVVIVLEEAEKCGILVDLTIGPRWPAAVPDLDPNSDIAYRKLAYSATIENGLTAGAEVQVELPQAPVFAEGAAVDEADFVALVAAKLAGDMETVYDATTGYTGVTTYSVTQTASIDETTLTVVDVADDGTSATFVPDSDGDYIFYAYWAVGVGQAAGSTNPVSYVVSHWNAEGTKELLDLWDETFAQYPTIAQHFATYGGNFFEDSLELTSADIPWCDEMAGYFAGNKGYDLTKYLPLLMGRLSTGGMSIHAEADITGVNAAGEEVVIPAEATYTSGQKVVATVNPDMAAEVFHDYQFNLSDMFNVNHIQQVQTWCADHNMNFRAQAQNTGGSGWNDALESQAYTGVAEGETLGMNSHPDAFRSLSGAANMGGNTHIVSVELGADRPAVYRMTWQRLVESVNRVVSNGANQMVLHGYPTRAQLNEFNKWPGWIPFDYSFFAEPWNEIQPSWDYMTNFTGYVSRLQTAMQYGAARVDFAVYRYGTVIGGSATDVQTLYREDPSVNPVADLGYSYNYISPGTFKLENGNVVDGVLNPEHAGYRALVIKDVTAMERSAAEEIKGYAEAGLPIILIGETPTKDYNYGKDDDAAVAEIFAGLLGMEGVVAIADENDLPAALEGLGIAPGAGYAANEISAVRRHGEEMDLYYLFNRSTTEDTSTTPSNESLTHDPTKAIDTTVTLTGEGLPYSLNPWTGEITAVSAYTDNGDGTVSMDITLLDSEVMLIALTSDAGLFEGLLTDAVSIETTGGAVPLDDGWTLSVESYQPGPAALAGEWDVPGSGYDGRDIDIVEMGPYTDVALAEWAEVSEELADISGRGLYTNTFTLEDGFTGAILDLGATFSNILEVTINGQTLPPVDQFNPILDLGGYVQQGENTLTVLIGTTLYKANVAAEGLASPDPWLAAYPDSYGLLGGVTVTPYVGTTAQ